MCWLESQPSLTVLDLHPTALLPLVGIESLLSACSCFVSAQGEVDKPELGRGDAFPPGESQTISTRGQGVFTGGNIVKEEKKKKSFIYLLFFKTLS